MPAPPAARILFAREMQGKRDIKFGWILAGQE
jgi:hypothetical protein